MLLLVLSLVFRVTVLQICTNKQSMRSRSRKQEQARNASLPAARLASFRLVRGRTSSCAALRKTIVCITICAPVSGLSASCEDRRNVLSLFSGHVMVSTRHGRGQPSDGTGELSSPASELHSPRCLVSASGNPKKTCCSSNLTGLPQQGQPVYNKMLRIVHYWIGASQFLFYEAVFSLHANTNCGVCLCRTGMQDAEFSGQQHSSARASMQMMCHQSTTKSR